MREQRSLRVCLDARLVTGAAGGAEQTVLGLAHGLSQLTDGEEEYLFLAHTNGAEWLRPHLGGRCRLLLGPAIPRSARAKQVLKTALPFSQNLWWLYRSFVPAEKPELPRSDGTIERARIDLAHFTLQSCDITKVPCLFQVHDLQHVHFPEFFSPQAHLRREVLYRASCSQARLVSVMTRWGKEDLARQYGVPRDKIVVIPWAPALDAYVTPSPADLAEVRRKFELPERFLFYPAQTWPHKNHRNLLEALAILRERNGLDIPVIFSGTLNSHYPQIRRRARELGLTAQIRFLGFVTPIELQALYTIGWAFVFPSKFEGFGMPVLEAFAAGLPVVCSSVTCLPELAGDAALLFDPDRPEDIATAIGRVWQDEALRQVLVERGRSRVKEFSWVRTARIFRAHYRRLGGRELTAEDHALIALSTSV